MHIFVLFVSLFLHGGKKVINAYRPDPPDVWQVEQYRVKRK